MQYDGHVALCETPLTPSSSVGCRMWRPTPEILGFADPPNPGFRVRGWGQTPKSGDLDYTRLGICVAR